MQWRPPARKQLLKTERVCSLLNPPFLNREFLFLDSCAEAPRVERRSSWPVSPVTIPSAQSRANCTFLQVLELIEEEDSSRAAGCCALKDEPQCKLAYTSVHGCAVDDSKGRRG